MTGLEILGAGFIAFFVIGSLLYKPVICPICDGAMFRNNSDEVVCIDCGWRRP